MKWFPALIALLLFCLFSRAQQGAINQRSFFFNISSTATPIQVNGDLDEPIWQTAEQVSRFNMRFPNDTAAVKAKTSVQVCYDNRFIYIAAVCSDTTPNVVQSLKRDVNFNDNDMFAVVLDPFNEQANGYVFGVNPLNVQYDDLLSSTNLEPQNFGWDNKWYSAVKRMPGKWVVEMAIPFKILRYPANKTTWGINFLRNDLKHYQYSTWAKVPVQFTAYDLGYTGAMHWAAPPVKQHNNIVLSPFVTGAMVKPQGNAATEKKLDAGFDAKIALNSSLNLDLTVNPDFSQIEVDVQQINLTRYNIFFPERRTFFLENNDLFFNFGSTDYRPYYSRTIGLDSQAAAIPILAGLRLTGNLTKKMRVGIMNMHTRATSNYKAQNYSAVAINQRVLKRSVLKAFFNNRQAFDKDKGPSSTDYGRNMGSEFNFFSKTGKWVSWLAGNWSFKNGYKNNNQFLEAGVAYTSNNFNSVIDLTDMGTNYYADMGFINRIENYDALRDTFIRVGFKQAYNQNDYTHRVNHPKIQYHRFINENIFFWNRNGTFNESSNTLRYVLNFTSTAEFSAAQTLFNADVLFPFTFTNGVPLPAGKYSYTQGNLFFRSDKRKKFMWEINANAGSFYNGTIKTFITRLRMRKQPWGNFSVDVQWNELRFPQPYGNSNLLLVRPKIEINFSNNLFWTTFIQYATQTNNFNINSRIQYRFKPMSDIFLVYTDNYFTDPFLKNKNRALVFKINYWLNL